MNTVQKRSLVLFELRWVNTLRPCTKWLPFCRWHFQINFHAKKLWYFDPKFIEVPEGPFDFKPVLVQVMAWCRTGNKPLPEPILAKIHEAYSVSRPQWVKEIYSSILLIQIITLITLSTLHNKKTVCGAVSSRTGARSNEVETWRNLWWRLLNQFLTFIPFSVCWEYSKDCWIIQFNSIQ